MVAAAVADPRSAPGGGAGCIMYKTYIAQVDTSVVMYAYNIM